MALDGGGPSISEHYKAYRPSVNFTKLVRDLLTAVPGEYLRGLHAIVLTNRDAASGRDKRKRFWQKDRKHKLAESMGVYSHAGANNPATIRIFVDNIERESPAWALRMPVLRHLAVGDVLYHEIGHHIDAVHRPKWGGKENVAEDWNRQLKASFIRQRAWYRKPILRVLPWLMRALRGPDVRETHS
jgi:hypothetical protein